MQISQQLWVCKEGGPERVYGTGEADKKASPLIYCAKHGRLCRHGYVRNQDAEFITFKQGTNVVDIVN
jgi:hypothetical protein